jgi:uncharacterized protein (TIGR02246 family)
MKTRTLLLAVLAIALASTPCQLPAQEAGPLSDEDALAIRAVPQALTEAALASDWAGVAALYTEDAVFMPPNEPAVQGRAAIEAWFAVFPPFTEFNVEVTEIDGRGDLGFLRATFSMTIVPEGAPEPIQATGKVLAIYRRQPDGTWLIAVDIHNTDQPSPEEGSGS